MTALTAPECARAPTVKPVPADGFAPHPLATAWPHRTSYGDWCLAQADAPDAGSGLQRLLVLRDAALDADAQLALHRALWLLWQRADAAQRDAAVCALDGRHAALLLMLERDWDDPALIAACIDSSPAGERVSFAAALLAHHGIDPLAQPASAPMAGLLVWAVRAQLRDARAMADAARRARLQHGLLELAGACPERLGEAFALLFELARHDGSDAATGVLAQCLLAGAADALDTDAVRRWLDDTGADTAADGAEPGLPERVLLLEPRLQRQWLRPSGWLQPGVLRRLHDACSRPHVRARIAALMHALGLADDDAVAPPLDGAAASALRALTALDAAYALGEQGGDALEPLAQLPLATLLAPAAIAALYVDRARWHAARGQREPTALALAQVRRHLGSPAVRMALQALLPGAPAFGPVPQQELPWWQAQAEHAPAEDLRRIAHWHLAVLYAQGAVEPNPPLRVHQQPARAQAHAQALVGHTWHEPLASALVREPELALVRASGHADDDDLLWLDGGADATGVTVVFSCVASYSRYVEIATLRGRLARQHLVFVRARDKNWTCDEAWTRIHAALRTRVAERFAPSAVRCWYGSMGGHTALKIALAFGWRAIVFNPQIDLDLWAAFRPRERALLWGSTRHRGIVDAPPAAWARTPLYIACGASTADRAAFSLLVAAWQRCAHLDLIVEKFDDRNHAGLMHRIVRVPMAEAIEAIDARLRALADATDVPAGFGAPLGSAAAAAFWQELDRCARARLEVRVRDGVLRWAASQATGTRAA